jgi:hypothetical protein
MLRVTGPRGPAADLEFGQEDALMVSSSAIPRWDRPGRLLHCLFRHFGASDSTPRLSDG